MDPLTSVFSSLELFQEDETEILSVTTCLWILHANKIPPHAGLSQQGLYYSLKAKGRDWKLPVSALLDTIERKRIPSVCFVLTDQAEPIENHFARYERAQAGRSTCLYPIREALGVNEATQLAELLNGLLAEKRILRSFGFHLPEGYSNLPEYSMESIHAHLEQLNHG